MASGGGVASKDAGGKPTRTYSRRPPPDATRPGKAENRLLMGIAVPNCGPLARLPSVTDREETEKKGSS